MFLLRQEMPGHASNPTAATWSAQHNGGIAFFPVLGESENFEYVFEIEEDDEIRDQLGYFFGEASKNEIPHFAHDVEPLQFGQPVPPEAKLFLKYCSLKIYC